MVFDCGLPDWPVRHCTTYLYEVATRGKRSLPQLTRPPSYHINMRPSTHRCNTMHSAGGSRRTSCLESVGSESCAPRSSHKPSLAHRGSFYNNTFDALMIFVVRQHATVAHCHAWPTRGRLGPSTGLYFECHAPTDPRSNTTFSSGLVAGVEALLCDPRRCIDPLTHSFIHCPQKLAVLAAHKRSGLGLRGLGHNFLATFDVVVPWVKPETSRC